MQPRRRYKDSNSVTARWQVYTREERRREGAFRITDDIVALDPRGESSPTFKYRENYFLSGKHLSAVTTTE